LKSVVEFAARISLNVYVKEDGRLMDDARLQHQQLSME
jgi:hypothetical protein